MNPTDDVPTFTATVFSWKDGKKWFEAGVNLFRQVKRQWYIACLMFGVLMLLIANLSADLVTLLMVFVSPMITAFMMNCCRQASELNAIPMVKLWQPIFENISALIILGLMTALISYLFNYLHMEILKAYELPVVLTEAYVRNMSGKESLFRASLNLLTNLPMVMALAFSPALIIFKQTKPINAIIFSALGVIRSWRAFVALTLVFLLLFFAVVMVASLLISLIMAVLGPASPIVINVIVLFLVITAGGLGLGAQYQAYTEIFTSRAENDTDSGDDDDTKIYAEI